MYSCGPPHMDVQEWDDQHEHTYSNYVRTQDVTLKTCRRRWMIGRNGERGSRISALAAGHDDDDDICLTSFLFFFFFIETVIHICCSATSSLTCKVIWWDGEYNDIFRRNKFIMTILPGLSFLLIALYSKLLLLTGYWPYVNRISLIK